MGIFVETGSISDFVAHSNSGSYCEHAKFESGPVSAKSPAW